MEKCKGRKKHHLAWKDVPPGRPGFPILPKTHPILAAGGGGERAMRQGRRAPTAVFIRRHAAAPESALVAQKRLIHLDEGGGLEWVSSEPEFRSTKFYRCAASQWSAAFTPLHRPKDFVRSADRSAAQVEAD